MQVIVDYPPNIDEIDAVLHVKGKTTIVYTFGDTIYSPGTGELDLDLHAHEEVHMRQQKEIGTPRDWWNLYLNDMTFRLNQEVEAYRAQWAYAEQNYNRARRRDLFKHVTKALSSPMYGSIVTRKEAADLILGDS